jgi:hypothetical protein
VTATAVESGVSFERVIRALEDTGKTVQLRGSQEALAQCPAHDDHRPSLSISWKDGKTLLHCFRGCTGDRGHYDPAPVCEALGLDPRVSLADTPRDLKSPTPAIGMRRRPRAPQGAAANRPDNAKQNALGRPTGRWRVVDQYVYVTAQGEPCAKVIRRQRPHEQGYAKEFSQKHWRGQCRGDACKHDAAGWAYGAPASPVLYNLPQVLTAIAAGHEIWMPEGEKDADALNAHFRAHDMPAVATTYAGGGVAWRAKYAEALKDASIVIVEDKDPERTNPVTGQPVEPTGPKRTRLLLADLTKYAASVRVVRARAGKDSFDHLAAGHNAGEFVPVAPRAAPSRPAPQPGRARPALEVLTGGLGGPGGGGGSGGGGGQADLEEPNRRTRYLLRHGELVREVHQRGGEVHYDVVLGCVARIVRMDQKVISEDQTPTTTGYLIEVNHPEHDGEPLHLRVPRRAWESGEWLHDLPWAGVFYDSSRNGLAKARDAIRTTSTAARTALVHGAPGWVRGSDGAWMFVHAGGAIGVPGVTAADTDLSPKLARYQLPAPPGHPADLRSAAAHSLALLDKLPPRIGAVLAGIAYRAAICRMPSAVTLIGPPGTYKTSMAKVALHHFAPDLPFDESILSLSERGATGNAGAKLMHLARDILILADDAAPDRSLKAASERVASIVRLQYNGETRDRLDQDAQMRPAEPPRGSLLVSAEVAPSAASARQRTLMVPFAQGEITREARLELWEPSSRHGRAQLLASFIAWQAPRREEILSKAGDLALDYADRWHEHGFDERTAEALAHLAAGWRLMLDHLTEDGCFTADEAADLWQRAWAGLAEAGRTQEDPDECADPSRRILARLRTALIGRYGHVTSRDGAPPPVSDAPRYGYAVEQAPSRSGYSVDSGPSFTIRPGGDWTGCYHDDDGERRLYLVPELALVMLRKLADKLGEPFEETVSSVGEWLRKADVGLVTTLEKNGRLRRSTQHIMPGGRRLWVWDIPESALFGDDRDPGDAPLPDPPAPPPPPGGRDHGACDEQGAPPPPAAAGPTPAGRPAGRPDTDQPHDRAEAIMTSPPHSPADAGTSPAPPVSGGGETGERPVSDPAAGPDGPPPAEPSASGPGRGGAPGSRRRGPDTGERRWRAAAAVIDRDAIWLPGGEKIPLPPLAHAGDLARLPAELGLGWGGGKLPPAPGQLWLTAAFLTRLGLPAELPTDSLEASDELLTAAAQHPFLTGATADGWQISEASRTRLGHRMRIWRNDHRAGAQIVFIPYITADVPLIAGASPPELARRLDLFASLAGVPFARSAAYSGHDLLEQLDARRRQVVTGPSDPPPIPVGGEGNISFQRAPATAEASRQYLHSYDTTAAWLAAAMGTDLGLGVAEHADRPTFDPRLPGFWRITPPAWDSAAIPSPFTPQRTLPDGTAWLPTPTVALASDPYLFGLPIRPVEAWVWRDRTRYLDLWAREINTARLALADLADGGDAGAAAVLATVKDMYSSAITLFGSPQLDARDGRERHKYFRPSWSHLVITTARARLFRKILQVEERNPGLWPVAIDRDNLLYASDDPDPVSACPEPLRIGNRLGQVKTKGSCLLADAADALARGRFAFDALISPADWPPGPGGPGTTRPALTSKADPDA